MSPSEWPTLDAVLREAGFHWSATIIWAKDRASQEITREGAAGEVSVFSVDDIGFRDVPATDPSIANAKMQDITASFRDISVSPDGTVWAAIVQGDPSLASFDGEAWTLVPAGPEPYPGPYGGWFDMAVASDGLVWTAYLIGQQSLVVKTWDGDTWTQHEPVETLGGYGSLPRIMFAPDATIRFGVVGTFDGTSVHAIDAPNWTRRVRDYAFAPDGSAWLVIGDGSPSLYVIDDQTR